MARFSRRLVNGKQKIKTSAKDRKIARFRRQALYATPKMIYKIPLQVAKMTLVVANAGQSTFEFGVSLSDIVSGDLTAFQALYDEFKITGFKWKLVPRGNNAPVGTNTGFMYYSVLDRTDTNALTSVDAALEYPNCRKHKSWRTNSRYIPAYCPKLIHDVNNNPMLTIEKPRWLQLNTQTIGGTVYDDTIVSHIGCKIITDVNNGTNPITFDFYITMYCQFRNKK